MRQQENGNPQQKLFIDLLPRLRNGECIVADWRLLLERCPNPVLNEEFKDAMRIFTENKPCDKYNIKKLNLLQSSITNCKVINSSKTGAKADDDKFRGLTNNLFVAIGV